MPRKDAMDMGELTDASFYILLSLIEEKHGYLIMKTIEDITKGEVSIGPASLYTTIKKLLKAELIRLIEETPDNKKVYITTNQGRDALIKEVARRKRMIEAAEKVFSEKGVEING